MLAAQDRTQDAFKPGMVAPDFSLEPRGAGAAMTLSAYRGTSPVALIFGSYT